MPVVPPPGGGPPGDFEPSELPLFLERVPIELLPGGGGIPLPDDGGTIPSLPGLRELAQRPKDFTRVPHKPLGEREFAWPDIGPQQLLPVNTTPNLQEGLEARIKDPLWFLARQWQSGEFEAESGGALAQLDVTSTATPVETLSVGGTATTLDVAAPLESQVEAEASDGTSAAWRSERLEYAFALEGAGVRLTAEEYDGTALDWYHFDLAAKARAGTGTTTTARLLPRTLRFTGMPHPRWWRFEDGDVDLTMIASTQPNVLQLILGEFLMIDSNDWYIVPLELPVGCLRRIGHVGVVDSFGVWRDVPPTLGAPGKEPWELFTLSDPSAVGTLDGASMFLPNVAGAILEGEPFEEIEFRRDEDANVVWAVERYHLDDDGNRVNRGDVEAQREDPIDGLAAPGAIDPADRGLPIFRLARQAGKHWIPYLPRRLAGAGAQIYLRRGRTDEHATVADPQYRSAIVGESWRLEEQEVPRTGVRIRRGWRFARGFDGRAHFWIGRRKEPLSAERTAGLEFDFLHRP